MLSKSQLLLLGVKKARHPFQKLGLEGAGQDFRALVVSRPWKWGQQLWGPWEGVGRASGLQKGESQLKKAQTQSLDPVRPWCVTSSPLPDLQPLQHQGQHIFSPSRPAFQTPLPRG